MTNPKLKNSTEDALDESVQDEPGEDIWDNLFMQQQFIHPSSDQLRDPEWYS